MLIKNSFSVLTVILLIGIFACEKETGVKPPPPSVSETGKASVWMTTGDQGKLFNEDGDISVKVKGMTNLPVIAIDESQKMQAMEGFGAALTGSSAFLIKNLPATQRNSLLQELFDPASGIGISYLRITMGSSDFSLSDYTYNDMPTGVTDTDLSEFSLNKDADVISVLKQIIAVSPGIKIMATPWSAPAWMKVNGSLKYVPGQANKLQEQYYNVYAQYFVKYIKAMKTEGITIDAITTQNEPLYFTAGYPSMNMEANEQIDFIKNHLAPAFKAENVQTKIISYDHNWDNTNYPIAVLSDTGAKSVIAGTAFHGYAGDVSSMSLVHFAHPDRGIYFTEVSGGQWATDFSENLQWNMRNVFIGATRNWSKNVLLWNLALNENFGPTNNGCANCRGVVTIASGSVRSRNVEYYSIGHFSKFIRPGAVRITSSLSGSLPNVEYVAFMNTDDTKVLVVANNDTSIQTFTVQQGTSQFDYSIPAKSLVTITWNL